MIHGTGVFQIYNLALGGMAAVGLLYLLFRTSFVDAYRSFVHLMVAGLTLFAVGGPIVDIVAPAWSHLIHGIAAVLVILGLYNPVHNRLRREEWAGLLLRDPSLMRQPSAWMTPMDDDILEIFRTTDLVLTPAIIAYNTGYSREEVNRRLSELDDHGFVERVERGKYRITDVGAAYLSGFGREGRMYDGIVGGAH